MAQTFTEAIDFSVARPGTDVVLVAENKEIHVNKEVMSMFSPYFRTLLQSPNFIESSSDRVDIDHSYELLLKCVEIIHQTCSFPEGTMLLDAIEELIKSADRFDLAVVRRFCQCELIRHNNKIGAYFVAQRYKLEEATAELLLKTSACDWVNWRDRFGYVDDIEEPLFNPIELRCILNRSNTF